MSKLRQSGMEHGAATSAPIFRPNRVRTAFGFALLVLSLQGIGFVWTMWRVEQETHRIADANAVLNRLYDVLAAYRESVSTSQSAGPGAVRAHEQSIEALESALNDVGQRTLGNARQQEFVAFLKASIARIVALERRRQELIAREGVEAGESMYLRAGSRGLDVQIRHAIADIKAEEQSLLSRRMQDERTSRLEAAGALISTLLLGLGILLIVYYHLEREIAHRQRSESRLVDLNRLYMCLSQTNQAIVRARTRDDLFRSVCRAAVEHGRFAAAWIGVPESEGGSMRPFAWWGREAEYLRNLRVPMGEATQNRGPGMSAVREVRPFVCNDIAQDPRMLAQREQALAHECFSVAALPIQLEENVIGMFGVFADRTDFFDDETLRLLDEVASDISFALHTIRQEEQRRNAEREIRRLNRELETRVFERTSQLADANRRLAQKNEELARASRMKSEFLARMSHEFRTPLNSIIGFTDLLAEQGEGPLAESYSDYVRHVHEGAHHLLALVNEILDLSRIEAGRIDLRHEEFAAAMAIAEVLSVIRPLAEAKNIELHSGIPDALTTFGDRTRFKQVFYNLLSNAVKFTPPAGKVRVSAKTDYGEIRFCVSDTGIGVPSEQQAAIFEEFTQVAPGASGVKEGAGLGLTITRRIVELHGGRIWVESAPGQGSSFFFTMPAARAGECGPGELATTVA